MSKEQKTYLIAGVVGLIVLSILYVVTDKKADTLEKKAVTIERVEVKPIKSLSVTPILTE